VAVSARSEARRVLERKLKRWPTSGYAGRTNATMEKPIGRAAIAKVTIFRPWRRKTFIRRVS
jgi:hypothetical protein